jgi:hypothetical protein
VVDDVMLMSMNGDVVERKGSIWSSDSWRSMSSTCGPRDVISLVMVDYGRNGLIMMVTARDT